MNKFFILILLATVFTGAVLAAPVKTDLLSSIPQYITWQHTPGAFCITVAGRTASIYVSPNEWKGVIRAANDLGDDIRKVSGTASQIIQSNLPVEKSILVGTIGKSPLIDRLIAEKKLDVSSIKGQWESYLIQTIDDCLVIAGSDKRGTIYGIYDISEKIGVSPWYWWADVPARTSTSLYVKAGKYIQPSPEVKYRGIFINDEWPSFGGWATNRFGGVNSEMYAHLFELLLRLKANYFWPAMWATAFNEDDPQNPAIADEYGIVMGTSHHEPMMRAHKEYTKRREEIGAWDYTTNKEKLDQFFTEGLIRNKAYDNLITIGMRGDGDVAMGKGDDDENIRTLRNVVEGQRDIIRKVYEKDPSAVPQLWAIFTEVQRYYDRGMTVPDDVLLLFCDNNWGYIRRTGPAKEQNRKGGMGLYYHIDMNGGPWNDRWVNTTTIPKLREQLNLAYQTGIDDLWIVNVGDLKPKEYPIDFIMRYAWNPNHIQAEQTEDYTKEWAAQNFGEEFAEEVAEIVSRYSQYNLMRKAEVQTPGLFSIVNHHEADLVAARWKEVAEKAEQLRKRIPASCQDAYYQLVYYPAVASAGIAGIYLAVTKNQLYAQQGRVSANDYAQQAKELFEQDRRLSNYYNDTLANGKWKNMMSDIHIGYKQWSMPEKAELPSLTYVTPLDKPTMGLNVEGCEEAEEEKAELPVFDALLNSSYYIDVFNRGTGSFTFTAKADKPWIKLSHTKGKVNTERRIQVTIDWNQMKEGKDSATILIQQDTQVIPVTAYAVKAPQPQTSEPYFGNLSGKEFSIPAAEYNKNIPGKETRWSLLPGLGKDYACMGQSNVTAPSIIGSDAPCLEYQILLPDTGSTTICLGILPTQDINPERGLRIAVSIDNDAPQILDARQGLHDEFKEYTPENLKKSNILKAFPKSNPNLYLTGYKKRMRNEVFDNIRWLDTQLHVTTPGLHTLKIRMVDPEVVLEKIVINPDNRYPSYLGAPPVRHNIK